MKKAQNVINHIALVLDASGSMRGLAAKVVKVADAQIAYLARRSKELDQETRITVYTFANQTDCLIYDKDVLRMPSIAGLYRADGGTALIDATLKAIGDLSQTPEIYGEHSFLLYVMTDGEENQSIARPSTLEATIDKLKDHWTLACFVPDQNGVFEAKRFGFPKDNIAVWDATEKGFEAAGERIRKTTDAFMQGRAKGFRGFKNLFTLDVNNLDKRTVTSALNKLGPGQFRLWDISRDGRIDEFVETKTRRAYRLGEGYYQLTKPVDVQPQKSIALFDRKGYAVYTGAEARKLLGLPSHTVRVAPSAHKDYDIFIQSTSVNRKLLAGTKLLLLS